MTCKILLHMQYYYRLILSLDKEEFAPDKLNVWKCKMVNGQIILNPSSPPPHTHMNNWKKINKSLPMDLDIPRQIVKEV